MKMGAKVRVIGVPDGLPDSPEMATKTIFLRCVGREFVIAGFNQYGMAEINIESVTGSLGETIWIERFFWN